MAQKKNELCDICENEYITTTLSTRALAKKYDISNSAVLEWCKTNEWVKKRKEFRDKVKEKTLKKIEESVVDKKTRLYSNNLKLIEQLQEILGKKLNYISKQDPENVKESDLLSMVKSVATINTIVVDSITTTTNESMNKLDNLINAIKEMD